jgi:hypothetical protein
MSETAMIEKVSVFLSNASFDSHTDRDLLETSVHDHDLSIVNLYTSRCVSNSTKPEVEIGLDGNVKKDEKLKHVYGRSTSVLHKIQQKF